jgi:hypothetical protein
MWNQRFDALSKLPEYRGSALYKALPAYRESVPLYMALHEFAELPPPTALQASLDTKLGQGVTKDAKTFETNIGVLATEFGKAKEGASIW